MIRLKDIVVTSIKKIVLDSYEKHLSSIPITFKFDKKDAEVTSYKVKVLDDVVEGSVQFGIVDFNSNNVINANLVGLVIQDESYEDNYTISSYDINSGIVTVVEPLLRDVSAYETFNIDVINVVKIFESASMIDKTKQTTRGLRVRVKPFDITISCKDDSGEVADKIGTWLTYILSNEHYRAYDELGNVIGNRIFYTNRQPQFSSVGKEVNNSLYYGRVSFAIYESYCDSLNNL
jgi:hypothetical protein